MNETTPPRIAIPMPHSTDQEYSERAIPQYENAVKQAGGEPVRIPLDRSAEDVMNLLAQCDAVLLPGSKADVDPAQFKAERSAHTAPADPQRDAVDYLLLEDAYAAHKPVLGICYGLQSLNVYRGGSLVQHIPEFLPPAMRGKVNHDAGKNVKIAHRVKVEPGSMLASVIDAAATDEAVPVNSSHHQAADAIGDGLRIVARCAEDAIVEALEGSAPDHFVLAVQWHPERSVEEDEPSRTIFRLLIEAAEKRRRNFGKRGG
jgi:putative glutamine amidotransferase